MMIKNEKFILELLWCLKNCAALEPQINKICVWRFFVFAQVRNPQTTSSH